MNVSNLSEYRDAHPIYVVDWNELERILQRFHQQIQTDGCPDLLLGLQRGGLIPTVYLSHALNVRNVSVLPISRTVSDDILAEKKSPLLEYKQVDFLRSLVEQKDILVIDDIAGTGETIQEVLHSLMPFHPKRIRSAVCVVNRDNWHQHRKQNPGDVFTYIGREISGWAVFPWERSHYLSLTESVIAPTSHAIQSRSE